MTQSYALQHARRVSSVVDRASFNEAAAQARLFRSPTRSLNTFRLDRQYVRPARHQRRGAEGQAQQCRGPAALLEPGGGAVARHCRQSGLLRPVADADGALIDFRGRKTAARNTGSMGCITAAISPRTPKEPAGWPASRRQGTHYRPHRGSLQGRIHLPDLYRRAHYFAIRRIDRRTGRIGRAKQRESRLAGLIYAWVCRRRR